MEIAAQPVFDPAKTTIFGAPEGQDARILADKARELARSRRALVHIALDDTRMSVLAECLSFFAPDVEVVPFPAWDCLPYDRVSPHHDIVAGRVAGLCRLLAWEQDEKFLPRIVLTTVNAAAQRVMPPAAMSQGRFELARGARLDHEKMRRFLALNGYMRAQTVREPGEYALRGGIVDIFPPGAAQPLRIDLFGDEIETLRRFDPLSQLSEGAVESAPLYPAREFFLDEESVGRFRAGYREAFGTLQDGNPLYEAVSAGRAYNGMEHWLPLFYDGMAVLFDYVPGAAVTQDQHAGQAYGERLAQIRDYYSSRKTLEQAEAASSGGAVYHPLPPARLYVEEEQWQGLTAKTQEFSPFGPPDGQKKSESGGACGSDGSGSDGGGRKGRDFADIRALPDGDVFAALKEYVSQFSRVVVAAYSEGSRERLKGLMEHAGIGPLKICAGYDDVKHLASGDIGLCVLSLEHGFVAPDLCVLSEQDILGDRLARRAAGRRKKADNFLTEVSALGEGDLVVHEDHGVGRFEGLETLKAGGTLHDCLKIVYAGDDRLFVPVENIDVLSRFGAADSAAVLDRLGGAAWQARKARVKKDLMQVADQLLKVAAARSLQKAERLRTGPDIYNEFAARFPYHETQDQQRAIDAVLEDLHSGRPMDRLVCGDVGFGKTEVALRAAFVAGMDGAQVAVVAPTTLLARQHYKTFEERLAGTGLRVGMLSRLSGAAKAGEVRRGLAEGSLNVVVGTHALFAKNISFANLGLLVVDEEQRFGVRQKERIKELRNNVHILTLSATPIPRTLQMSLSGVKDMSIIATPPVDRLAVRTFVLPYDPMVIREALLREYYRGGQSFYVCPRIRDMEKLEAQIRELVPEIKVVSAHGQMSPADLEDRMSAFYDGRYDVLLATNIIESGLDIPRANTMVIHRADLFGLAQLYQIRGRIGRSKLRAYAYLTYPPDMRLNAQAQKRLEVIEMLDTLGSGFQLASHDMDIRGAGNLLGEEQSGHVKEIGVELYQQMLEEAVAAAKAGVDLDAQEGAAETWSPQINIGASVLIPENYVEDLGVRMSLYRRLAGLETQDDIEAFAAELIDRFGALPAEVANLLDILAIKQLSRRAGVDKVEAGPKGAVIGFYKDMPPAIDALMGWMAAQSGRVKLRADQKIVLSQSWPKPGDRIKGVRAVMKDLADLPESG